MIITERRERALNALNYNRGEGSYTPPALGHYPHIYDWDTVFIAFVRARSGDIDGAKQELRVLFQTQNPKTGFIPNMTFAPGEKEFDPERLTFMTRRNSDYSQPMVSALAIQEIYEGLITQGKLEDAISFHQEMFPHLQKELKYWINNRENGRIHPPFASHLIGNIHPHETGRDADPTFDEPAKKFRLPTVGKDTNKLVRVANTILDYASTLRLNRHLRSLDWDARKARRAFWVNDVMFNCIYADSLSVAADLAETGNHSNAADLFRKRFKHVEEEILTKMWNEDDQMFYALQDGKTHIPVVSVSNLFPLLLPNIKKEQLQRMFDVMEDPDWFGTKYPLPSVPVNSKFYDPDYQEARIWRGPTWINMNWYLVKRGLLRQSKNLQEVDPELAQRCFRVGMHIARQTAELIDQGYFEFYNPETGKPLRTGTVRNFAWSTLGEDLAEMAEDFGSHRW